MLSSNDIIDDPKGWKFFSETVSELLKVIVISLVIIIPVRYFLLQPFFVKGASMEPNFYDHEYLVIDEISYRFKNPQRGEIVVFRYPKDARQYFIKRIIGLPNDSLEIKDNSIYINGVKLDEKTYLPAETTTFGNVFIKLGPDEFFLMGDNRNFSLDSRSFGSVDRRFIVGRAWFRGFPFNEFKIFEPPAYKL
ncbi:signal peptidase I [Candidatus Uhrbacteria bacterium]|nr:signal peptidase I [Candidatus Uhrbacteria bacterium]